MLGRSVGCISHVAASTSAKAGRNPACRTAIVVALIVSGGTAMCSPAGRSSASKAVCRVAVPLQSAMA